MTNQPPDAPAGAAEQQLRAPGTAPETDPGTSPHTPRSGPAGTTHRLTGKDGPQLIHSAGHRWTDEAERIFLDRLGASCNYTHSARAAGFSREAVYKRRRRDPAFQRRCDDAVAQGYARIEALLVESAEHALEGRAPDPDSPIPPMSVRDALAILQLHRRTARGEGKGAGWRARPRSLDEVRDSILAKLAAFERARAARS